MNTIDIEELECSIAPAGAAGGTHIVIYETIIIIAIMVL
jgi:hypothetical protein